MTEPEFCVECHGCAAYTELDDFAAVLAFADQHGHATVSFYHRQYLAGWLADEAGDYLRTAVP